MWVTQQLFSYFPFKVVRSEVEVSLLPFQSIKDIFGKVKWSFCVCLSVCVSLCLFITTVTQKVIVRFWWTLAVWCRWTKVSLSLITGKICQSSRSQRSNNCCKMVDFRLKSRFLKKLLTNFNDFWLRRCRIQIASLDLIKVITVYRSRSQRSNNCPKSVDFRLS